MPAWLEACFGSLIMSDYIHIYTIFFVSPLPLSLCLLLFSAVCAHACCLLLLLLIFFLFLLRAFCYLLEAVTAVRIAIANMPTVALRAQQEVPS